MSENEICGPFRIASITDVPPVARAIDCPKLQDCTRKASKKDWPGFTCSGCSDLIGSVFVVEPPEVHAQVQLRIFLNRIRNNPIARGYTEANFMRKIVHDVKLYYGAKSPELYYISIQVKVLGLVLEESGDDIGGLVSESNRLAQQFNNPIDLYTLYLDVCGKMI